MLLKRFFNFQFIRNYARSSTISVKSNVLASLFETPPAKIKWESIRNDLITNDVAVNKNNVDGIIISKCFSGYRLDIAKSYLEYLKANSLAVNDASISMLMRLYYGKYRENPEKLVAEDESEIIKWCKMLINKHEIMDASTCENIIHGLSLTSEWMLGLKLLDQLKLTAKPTENCYSCLISKAISSDCNQLVWKLLNEMTSNQLVPKNFIFLEWINKYSTDYEKIEEMLQFISDNHILLPHIIIDTFSEAISKSYKCSLVTINRSGKCPSCTNKLPGVKLMESEFRNMAKHFLDNIFIKTDAFLKSNPDEIKRFKEFVDKSIPVDCVVDGLNVAYSQGAKLTPAVYSRILAQVVRHFVDDKKKCLVIGRKHMKFWPKREMSYIRENSSLFLTDDISSDDLFTLYAALKSGPSTYIFTRDLMRQHSHLLTPKYKRLFRRWQLEHQYSLIKIKGQHKMIVKPPVNFDIRAHKTLTRWHIPFTAENINTSDNTFEMPTAWICLDRKYI